MAEELAHVTFLHCSVKTIKKRDITFKQAILSIDCRRLRFNPDPTFSIASFLSLFLTALPTLSLLNLL